MLGFLRFSVWIYVSVLWRHSPSLNVITQKRGKLSMSGPNSLTSNIIIRKRYVPWARLTHVFIWFSSWFISPLPVKPGGGTIGFLAVCHSVRPSVCLSVSQSTQCPSTRFSELFSVVLWDIDLKFGIWICLHIIQIKFDFGRVWPTLTWVIALCKNFVFRTFLCHLSTYWVEISYIDLSWHNTGQVRLWSRLTYFYMSYCPLQKFRFPDFSLPSFDKLSWNFIYEFVLT